MIKKMAMPVFGRVPVAFLQDQEARAHVCVYAALSSFQGNSADSWPSYDAIAERAGCSDRQAKRSVKILADLGWIVKISTGGCIDGKNISNRYAVAIPCIESEPASDLPGDDTKDTPEQVRGDVDDTPGGDTDDTPRGDMDDTLKEHIKRTIRKEEEAPPTESQPAEPAAEKPSTFWNKIKSIGANMGVYGFNESVPAKLCVAFMDLRELGLTTNEQWIRRIIKEKKNPAYIVNAISNKEYAGEYKKTPAAAPRAPTGSPCPICGKLYDGGYCHACEYVESAYTDEQRQEAQRLAAQGRIKEAVDYLEPTRLDNLAKAFGKISA